MTDTIANQDFCDCITKHIYFKMFLVFVMSMCITFVDEVEILYSKYVFVVFVLALAIVMFAFPNEIGTLVLFVMLIVLIHNNISNEKSKHA
jgi:hypothetical protein